MRPQFCLLLMLALCLGGCGVVSTTSNRERLVKAEPSLAKEATQLYEISIDFWQKLDRLAFENEIKLLTTLNELGIPPTDARLVQNTRRAHEKWSKIFPYIRGRLNENKDIIFYYSSRSGDGILVVRHGRIREKIVLNGDGAWSPPESELRN